jgi:hypothetical protein
VLLTLASAAPAALRFGDEPLALENRDPSVKIGARNGAKK